VPTGGYVAGQGGERLLDLVADARVGEETVWPNGIARHRNPNASRFDNVGVDVSEHLAQRVMSVRCARRRGRPTGAVNFSGGLMSWTQDQPRPEGQTKTVLRAK